MNTTMQHWLIAPIVVAATLQIVWTLVSAATRERWLSRAAQTLAAYPQFKVLQDAVEQKLVRLRSSGGCAGCDRKGATPPMIALGLIFAATAGAPLHAATVAIVDDVGAKVALAAPATRIVSLSAGATELLFAAGAGDKIVATVQGADEPAAAKRIARVGDADNIDYAKLAAAKPDVVVLWHDMVNKRAVATLAKLKLPVYSVSVSHFRDFAGSVQRLGVLAGTSAIAESEARALARRAAALERKKFKGDPLAVFYMTWDVPLYSIGSRHLISEALAHCGARNIFDDIDFPAPIVEFENVVKRNPEVIFMSTTPITARDWRERWAPYTKIRAVAAKQVLVFEDVRLDRMGPSAFDAVPGLCEKVAAAHASLHATAR